MNMEEKADKLLAQESELSYFTRRCRQIGKYWVAGEKLTYEGKNDRISAKPGRRVSYSSGQIFCSARLTPPFSSRQYAKSIKWAWKFGDRRKNWIRIQGKYNKNPEKHDIILIVQGQRVSHLSG